MGLLSVNRRALGVAGTLALTAATSAFVGGADATTASSYRDSSGLLVISASRDEVVPEADRDAWAAYDALTEQYPDDLGYASPNLTSGTVEVGASTLDGQRVLADFAAGLPPGPTVATAAADMYPVSVSADDVESSGIDPGSAQNVTVASAKESKSKRRNAVAAAASAAKNLRARAKTGQASRRALEGIKDELITWALRPELASADLWSTEVERSTGSVIVRTTALTPALSSAIVSRYGAEQIVVIIEPNPNLSTGATRLTDVTSFWGGSRINAPAGSCTSGFAWKLSSGASAMATAGHCAPNGGAVSTPASPMGSVGATYYENYRLGTGTVTVPGYSGYHGDGAIIQVQSGKSSAPAIYRGGTSSSSGSNVVSMFTRRAARGDLFCTGGRFSGELCGWGVFATGINLTVTNHGVTEVARNVVRGQKEGYCGKLGDSGGSVFYLAPGGVTAKGIHNGGGGGGGDNYGGAFDPCTEYHTDIWDVYYGLPGYLKTA